MLTDNFLTSNSLNLEGRKASVLVVEDEFIIAASIQRSLLRLGYSIHGVCNSPEGLEEQFKNALPDIILMDIELEGQTTGIDAAQALRDTYGIPVLFISGLREEEVIRRVPETMPFGFIAKPFTDHQLRMALSIALYKARSETRIRSQEIQIQQLLENMNQGYCLLDDRGYIRYVNRKVLNTLGTVEERLRGKDARKFVVGGEAFFRIFRRGNDRPLRLPRKICPEPFQTKIVFEQVSIPCYIVPQLIIDEHTSILQGCFLSILNLNNLGGKTAENMVE